LCVTTVNKEVKKFQLMMSTRSSISKAADGVVVVLVAVIALSFVSHEQSAAAAFTPRLAQTSSSRTTSVRFAASRSPLFRSRHDRNDRRPHVVLSSSTVQAPSSSTSPKQQDGGIVDDSVPVEKPNNKSEEKKESFDWFQQWYPLVPVEILDPEVPHKFQLLGQDIVVWNDGTVGDEEFARKTKKSAAGGSKNIAKCH
jgi:ABC-type microcin C transport system duplicated ATPase subunit YejF